jgi:signal transduction histidine kinase
MTPMIGLAFHLGGGRATHQLSLSSNGLQVSVKIADTGIGIEKTALPHVFDRFWGADKVRSRAEGEPDSASHSQSRLFSATAAPYR